MKTRIVVDIDIVGPQTLDATVLRITHGISINFYRVIVRSQENPIVACANAPIVKYGDIDRSICGNSSKIGLGYEISINGYKGRIKNADAVSRSVGRTCIGNGWLPMAHDFEMGNPHIGSIQN